MYPRLQPYAYPTKFWLLHFVSTQARALPPWP